MSEKINAFLALAEVFKTKGFRLYLVGGTVRDYFLNIPLNDMDLVTNATPNEMKTFLDNKCADFTFEKYGYVKYRYNNIKLDIVTLRKERKYKDARHPSRVKFVKKLKTDVKRRDFTINGLYLDECFHLFDYVGGKNDIERRILRVIGRPSKRLKEDPLRILRAIRFSIDYSFTIEEKLNKSMIKYAYLIDEIKKDKIKQELKKIHCQNEEVIKDVFAKYNLTDLYFERKR